MASHEYDFYKKQQTFQTQLVANVLLVLIDKICRNTEDDDSRKPEMKEKVMILCLNVLTLVSALNFLEDVGLYYVLLSDVHIYWSTFTIVCVVSPFVLVIGIVIQLFLSKKWDNSHPRMIIIYFRSIIINLYNFGYILAKS